MLSVFVLVRYHVPEEEVPKLYAESFATDNPADELWGSFGTREEAEHWYAANKKEPNSYYKIVELKITAVPK